MNGRERMQTILEKRTPDRMGLYEHFWPETLPGWIEQGYPADEEGKPRPPEEVFGYDLQGVGPGVDWQPRRGYREVVEESEDWELTRNGAGALMRTWKHKSGTPEHVDFEMTSRAYWDRVKEPLLELDPERVSDLEEYRKNREKVRAEGRLAICGAMFVFEYMRASMGDLCMFESMLSDPDWIRDFCRTYTDFQLRHYRYAFDKAGKPDAAFIYEDLGYTNGLWASPEVLAELVMEEGFGIVQQPAGEDAPAALAGRRLGRAILAARGLGDGLALGGDTFHEGGHVCLSPLFPWFFVHVVSVFAKSLIRYLQHSDFFSTVDGNQSWARRFLSASLRASRSEFLAMTRASPLSSSRAATPD